jgi:hypothetical protein
LKHVIEYKDKLKIYPIYECVACERLWFKSQTFHFTKKRTQHLTKYVPCLETTKFELLGELFVCHTCIKLVNVDKEPKYLVLNNISMNPIISSILDLHELEEKLITSRQTFTQIWQVQGYGQYKTRCNIINVPTNVNKTQSILPCMLDDEAIIGIILKCKLEYKSLYLP